MVERCSFCIKVSESVELCAKCDDAWVSSVLARPDGDATDLFLCVGVYETGDKTETLDRPAVELFK